MPTNLTLPVVATCAAARASTLPRCLALTITNSFGHKPRKAVHIFQSVGQTCDTT